MLKCFIPLAIAFFFHVSCSDESGNKSVAPMNNENVESPVTFSFNTYNGLVAEEPCSENLRGAVAHVNESNLDYICVFDDALTVWNWRMLQNSSVEPISVQSSSSNNSTEHQYYSSSYYFISSSTTSTYSSIEHSKSSSSGISSSVMQTLSSSSKANWAYLNPAISYGEIEHSLESYKTVTIGSQTWMAENMNYYAGCLMYKPHELETDLGCLYSWDDARSICPKGWHLPDSTEFAELRRMISDPQQLASRVWKHIYVFVDFPSVTFQGSDKYGFSALPVGYTNDCSGVFCSLINEGAFASFWTSSSKSKMTAADGNYRYAFSISVNPISMEPSAGFESAPKTRGLSVRCVKDEW